MSQPPQSPQQQSPEQAPKISKSLWVALLVLGFAGQLAWAVENQFFNTFLYNEITPDPRPISWMVAITALVSTLTAIFMGALSDRTRTRWGRRKPYLVVGYIAWGVFTALFPASANLDTISAGVFMAILLDSLMTFFGATANDAAFNAYVADVTTVENRGKVTGALEIMKWLSILIVYGGAGIVIDLLGYQAFFYIVGGLVLLVGLISAPLLREVQPEEPPQGRYWEQILTTFRIENLRKNRDFFVVMIAVSLFGLGQNIFFPYLVVYLEHYIQLDALQYSLLVGVAILVGGILAAFPIGVLVDRWGRYPVAVLAVILEAVGLIAFSLTGNFVLLLLTGILWLAPNAAWTIAALAWSKDLFPNESRGLFAGYYVLFMVAFTMIPGPLIGGWLGSRFGKPVILDGQAGFVPTPLIFQVSAVVTLLALIPLLLVRRKPVQQKKKG
jgi:MFS family permease